MHFLKKTSMYINLHESHTVEDFLQMDERLRGEDGIKSCISS